MPNLAVKKFSWLRTSSLWERNQAWRQRQQEVRANFESANSAASSAFTSATINQVAGLGQIVARTASQRIQQQAIQKQLDTLA